MPRALGAALGLLTALAAPAGAAFVTFETGQVRPLALSADGSRLFALNTPDNRLEIFTVGTASLTHEASVPVGLEPCAVAVRNADEVWVVNHLSDSISVVDVASSPPRVVRTLLTGDEPRDIVFASNRAFVTTAHRGQNSPVDPQLTTEGVGRADVWVFDPANLDATLGGAPLTIVTLFGDTPRPLAASADGTTVYAGVFHSGNQTTALSEGLVCDGGSAAPACSVGGSSMPGGLPEPNTNFSGSPGPETGVIVKLDTGAVWRDGLGRNWNNAVRFTLPDLDVFAIDADATVPVLTSQFAHVGTVLYGMVANPLSGRLYVANTEARNEVRFEGPGTFGGSTVQGHLHETRITVIDPSAPSVTPRHLNKHIDYDVRPALPGTRDDSLSIPNALAISSDGATLYVAAFGSAKVGVFDTTALENDTFVPNAADHVQLTAGGPSGIVLDETRGQLYVLTRFDDGISVVDTTTNAEIAHVTMHNPEPPHVEAGRPILYDAFATTSNGESPCASCHVFGDFDSLGWDLGNPDDVVLANPNPVRFAGSDPFHPLKGPMTTQSLRGMANHGPMHWRGDRTGGTGGGDPLDELAGFSKFIVAFEGLLGRATAIETADMDAFGRFILEVTYPPNPIRNLDNSLTPQQTSGFDLYFAPNTDTLESCNGCHTLDPGAGFFGSSGDTTFEAEPQLFKVPHLRNMYQKVGMFGMPAVPFFAAGNNGPLGDQVRGFGFLHDGSVDTLFRFHSANVFVLLSTQDQADLEALMHVFDSNLAPIVGQQITLGPGSPATVGQRIDLLLARAAAGECDVIVKGTVGGLARGWVRLAAGTFQSDRQSEVTVSDASLRAQAANLGQEHTYTCVPPGTGQRIGVDRDDDGHFDRTEIDAGSDPADPTSIPPGGTTTSTSSTTSTSLPQPPPAVMIPTTVLRLKGQSIGVPIVKVKLESSTAGEPDPGRIIPGEDGSPGDPRLHGGELVVYSPVTGQQVTEPLRNFGWRVLAKKGEPIGYEFAGPAGGTLFVRSVKIKADKVIVKGILPYDLGQSPQERLAFRLSVGLADYCGEAPAKARGNPPSTKRFDNRRRFVASPRTPPPGACAVP